MLTLILSAIVRPFVCFSGKLKTRVCGEEEGDKERKEKERKRQRGNLCQRGDCRRLVAAERVSEHERERERESVVWASV